ncbi:DUF397 domain-containing protein [Actinomadura fibrosa]|uniref:DUF397 domain-containing protein n=1 Tax=Actinomadura fibrosa TaxID=111802 RepID=A0ABW2Y4X1_9ACTN|nr:DUF397 domain-containing protein [Actinomadura fibrosa]
MNLTGAAWRKASRSNDSGDACVELAVAWRKASRSNDSGDNCVELAVAWRRAVQSTDSGDNCVELRSVPGAIAVRDSKDVDGGVLLLTPRAFRELAGAIKER